MNSDKLTSSDLKLIIQTFSYTKSEQETFKYISEYMNLIRPYLEKKNIENDVLERFMTMGLFITYRVCNHMGSNFSTSMDRKQLSEVHRKRMELYVKFGGEPFDSTAEYLERLPPIIDAPAKIMAMYVIG